MRPPEARPVFLVGNLLLAWELGGTHHPPVPVRRCPGGGFAVHLRGRYWPVEGHAPEPVGSLPAGRNPDEWMEAPYTAIWSHMIL